MSTPAARLALPLAMALIGAGCAWPPFRPAAPVAAPGHLAPSPRLILGRIVAIDAARQFAFIALSPDAPPAALVEGTDLIARAMDLRPTARLRASRHLRGHTLGTTWLEGSPAIGDEVVWLAP